MSVASFLEFARVLPEPIVLVSGDGTVAGVNGAAAELLGRAAEALCGTRLSSLTMEASAEVTAYLGACARGKALLPGAFTFRGPGGAALRCRCDGALLQPAATSADTLIVLRLRYADAARTRFVLLNQQIEELSREVNERRRIEAERLELLARARKARQELEQERQALVAARDTLLDRTHDLERARGRLERLQAATAALSGALTPAHVASVVLEHCVAALDASAVSTLLLDESGDRLELVQYVGYPADTMKQWETIPLSSPAPVAVAARTGEAVFIESDTQWSARYGGALPRILPEARSWAALPLWVEGKALGAIGISFEREGASTTEDRAFMLALAQQSAQALERARLFAAAERARGEAEAANMAKVEFLATMSHELRTPLNAIAGYAELLELEIRGPVTDLQRADLRRIRRSQQHLLSLVNDVLNFARIDTGHVHYEISDVPLDEALGDMEVLIAPLLKARRLRYEYTCSMATDRVRVDREKMQQIVLNLLTNAVKFTEPGGTVTLSAHGSDTCAHVVVSDTGRGIPADKLEQIFEPFVQIERGLTRTRDGAGLGLAISRELALAMGGDLVAASVYGRGSTFTLTIPLAGAPAARSLMFDSVPSGSPDPVELT